MDLRNFLMPAQKPTPEQMAPKLPSNTMTPAPIAAQMDAERLMQANAQQQAQKAMLLQYLLGQGGAQPVTPTQPMLAPRY